MKKTTLILRYLCLWAFVLSSAGCGTLIQGPIETKPARLGEPTQSELHLKGLPPPSEKVVIAVYQFRDQTGQYKPNGGFSTAVTQGANNILIKALKDSKWFIPIERENVNNLLNERKIVRSSRAQFGFEEPLTPLLYANVILEGGIVSYDSNVLTGGSGVRYFGISSNEQYRQDRITVYLRLISVETGEILKTTYTSKTILSKALSGGIFQFVSFRRLLEAETGYTYNEPTEMALKEAIEKGIETLVIEGVYEQLWSLSEARDLQSEAFLRHRKEREEQPKTDIIGKKIDNRRARLWFSPSLNNLFYQGDFPQPEFSQGVGAALGFNPTSKIGLSFNYVLSNLSTEQFYDSDVSIFEGEFQYRILPYDRFTPYFYGGYGYITENRISRFDYTNPLFSKLHAGAGLEVMIGNFMGVTARVDYNYVLSDDLDGIDQGRYNDIYYRGQLGLRFYFGGNINTNQLFDSEGAYDILKSGF